MVLDHTPGDVFSDFFNYWKSWFMALWVFDKTSLYRFFYFLVCFITNIVQQKFNKSSLKIRLILKSKCVHTLWVFSTSPFSNPRHYQVAAGSVALQWDWSPHSINLPDLQGLQHNLIARFIMVIDSIPMRSFLGWWGKNPTGLNPRWTFSPDRKLSDQRRQTIYPELV